MRNVEFKSASGNARVMRMGFGMAKTALRAPSSPWWRKSVRGTRSAAAGNAGRLAAPLASWG